MLAIRMQRTGRKRLAMFRVVVQDARRTPTSGRVVALLGSYDPHTKTVTIQKDKASFYLEHGAQPSERVVKLFAGEGIALPAWVKQAATDKKRSTRKPEKRRSTRPVDKSAVAETSQGAPETVDGTSQPAVEQSAEAPTAETEVAAEDTPMETTEQDASKESGAQ